MSSKMKKGFFSSYVKYFKESKTFILYAVIAAIVGVFLTFFVGGCDSGADKANVLVSKRVRIEVKDAGVEEAATSPDGDEEGVVEEAIKPEPRKKPSAPEKITRAEKPAPPAPLTQKDKAPVKKAALAPRPVKKTAAAAKKTTSKPSYKIRPWAVNVVSFLSPGEADSLRKKLGSMGYNAYVTKFSKGSLLFYRVRVGFFKSRDQARKAGLSIAGKYKNVGKPWVVKPGWREVAEHIN